MQVHPIVLERKLEALRHALGEHVLAALCDPAVVEILVNPDGKLILDRVGEGRRDTGEVIAPEARERTVRLIGDHVGEPVGPQAPRLSGVLPSGERFQGVLAPVSRQPAYAIRKRPARIFGLDHYVAEGAMDAAQAQVLREAAKQRCNILISGGAGSGKTTLANAILAEPAYAQDRVILIEDTPELQCSSWDVLALLTRRAPHPVFVGDLVRDALRLRPDRIVVGELREGAAALEALKAWNTGHPGGLATLHANSAREAIARLEGLLGEVLAAPASSLVTQSVDRIVHIARTEAGRRVEEIVAVAHTGRNCSAGLTRLA
jgi:type IV secretion system protein VirB11